MLKRIYHKAYEKQIPLMVHFDLTYRCHQRCLHCYLPESWRRGEGPGSELSTLQIFHILDQLAGMGTFFLTLSGGEIFLRPDLFPILEYGRRRNFALSLFSSGNYGLGEDQVRALAELGIEGLVVSLYSLDARVHDRITGVPGSWAGLSRTIKLCQSLGVRLIFNSFVLSLNDREVPALRAWAAQEGAPIRLDAELTPRWDGSPHSPGLDLGEGGREYLQGLNREENPWTPALPPEISGCGAGINGCYLGAAGEVWPCIELPEVCGNLDNGVRFQEIWQDSPQLVRVRNLNKHLSGNRRLCDSRRESCKNQI
jgi:MoaA/NifB/PqqE/SkfB family radical SAM enzyme